MRLLLAALLVFCGFTALAVFLSSIPSLPLWLMVPLMTAGFFLLFAASFFLFSFTRIIPKAIRPTIEDLERPGMLEETTFHATRAFQIDEFEDEGSHYMIELADGSILYLNGQYLYDYEPIDDDPEFNQPRTFPCTDFTVRRLKTTGDGIDILCRGEVIEPECLTPHFDKRAIKAGAIPMDGDILTNRSYDEIRRECLTLKT